MFGRALGAWMPPAGGSPFAADAGDFAADAGRVRVALPEEAEPPPQPYSSASSARSSAGAVRRRALADPLALSALSAVICEHTVAMRLATIARARGRLDIHLSDPPAQRRGMDFQPSERCSEFKERLTAFMDAHIYPAEATYERQLQESGDPHHQPAVMEKL